MSLVSHWRKAMPFYLKASFRFSLIFWILPLAIVFLGMIWVAVTTHQLVVNRVGLGLTITYGGGFFLLAFVTSLATDLYRNREVQEGTIEWKPDLVWKAFIYLGAFFFLVAAFEPRVIAT
jgi:hypothetical protein